MTADQRAVDAAMKALDCEELHDRNGTRYCAIHHAGWLSDVNACVRAEAVAAAVVAAVQGPIKAEALREAADEFEVFSHVDDSHSSVIDPARVRLNIARTLRARADRIEAQP